MRFPIEELNRQESEDFHVICLIFGLEQSDFELIVECERSGGKGRRGRKLVHVVYNPSGRHRTYRAGVGNLWLPAFEEDIRACCFFDLSLRRA